MLEEDHSIYLKRIQAVARDPESKDYLAANKYLLEEPWKKPKVGRPSKEAIAQEASKLNDMNRLIEEAHTRINNRIQ